MAWDKYGIWAGNVEKENGEWLIGDHLPEDHPGYVAEDDPRGLMVKYWTASQNDESGKYLGDGHEPSLPAHGGRFEAVQVLFGWFWCDHNGNTFKLGRGSVPVIGRDSVELGPNEKHRWFLGDSAFGWGVTICRRVQALPEEFGAGVGYEYRVLDTAEVEPDRWPELLLAPFKVSIESWSFRLIMVFRGSMCRKSRE